MQHSFGDVLLWHVGKGQEYCQTSLHNLVWLRCILHLYNLWTVRAGKIFSHQKIFLHIDELQRVTTTFERRTEQYIFWKIYSSNSIFRLQYMEFIKSNVFNFLINGQKKNYINKIERDWLLSDKVKFLLVNDQCPTLFQAHLTCRWQH